MKKNMKLIAIVLVLFCSLLAFMGCSPKQAPSPNEATESATPTLDKIRARGTLIFGTESTYPPFQFIIIKDGKSVGVGMDVTLGEKIAERIGVKLVTSEMAFDSLIPALQADSIDIAGSMTPTDERKEVIDFSELYYESTNRFIVRKDESDKYTSKDDFKGKTIGAQLGTVQNTLLVEEFTDSNNLILPKVSSLIQELKNNNIDAICAEAPVADCYVKAHADLAVAEFSMPDESGGVGITMAKGTEDLAKVINEVILEMMANGEMKKIYDNNIELAVDQIISQ